MKRRLSVAGVSAALALGLAVQPASAGDPGHSVAQQWSELMLESIRNDFARPTIHARNLFHVSVAMWDAWAAYDPDADQWLHEEKLEAKDVEAAREEAISYAVYRLLLHRFQNAPGADNILPLYDQKMNDLGYDIKFDSTVGPTPAALGNRIAESIIQFGFTDGANELNGYENEYYEPVNPPLIPDFPGNPDIIDPNRWQPLALEYIDQGGFPIPTGYPDFLSPEWGQVVSFSLDPDDAEVYHRDGFDYWVFHDPGDPPYINGVGDQHYRWGFELVAIWSGHLDPADGVMWDISPASIGNIPAESLPTNFADYPSFYNLYDGGEISPGHDINPVTGKPYEPQIVPRGDYARVLAEFWADGPDSETPPGHWFTILNYVMDHPDFEKRLGGEGPIVDDLEFDVKAYLLLGGAMHDAAVTAWGIKGWYDYIRPISAIRDMADEGQCTDPDGPSYDVNGINLHEDWIEVITPETTAPGGKHEHLAGNEGKIALYGWRGPEFIEDPETDVAGVDWMLAEEWWPYQRPTFVTPPFAGYISGHSTFSRTAAEVMTLLTGSAFFPGGMGEFYCPQNEFLVFEEGPSMDITLQWATYNDASDQTSLSRIWGGIHPPADDIPGRLIGIELGPEVWEHANKYYEGRISCPPDVDNNDMVGTSDLLAVIGFWGMDGPGADLAEPYDVVDVQDLLVVLGNWGPCK